MRLALLEDARKGDDLGAQPDGGIRSTEGVMAFGTATDAHTRPVASGG
jgi:hypothetical protein